MSAQTGPFLGETARRGIRLGLLLGAGIWLLIVLLIGVAVWLPFWLVAMLVASLLGGVIVAMHHGPCFGSQLEHRPMIRRRHPAWLLVLVGVPLGLALGLALDLEASSVFADPPATCFMELGEWRPVGERLP